MIKLENFFTGMNSYDGMPWIFGALIFIFLACAVYQYFRFKNAWDNIISSFIEEIDLMGVQIVDCMIQIVLVTAEKKEAFVLGEINNRIASVKNSPYFHKEILPAIKDIQEANNGKNLNGLYTSLKEALEIIEILLKEYYSSKKSFENFSVLSIQTESARSKLEKLTEKLLARHKELCETEEEP